MEPTVKVYNLPGDWDELPVSTRKWVVEAGLYHPGYSCDPVRITITREILTNAEDTNEC